MIPVFKRLHNLDRVLMQIQENVGQVLDSIRNASFSKIAQWDPANKFLGFKRGDGQRSILDGVLFQDLRLQQGLDLLLPHGLNRQLPGAEFIVLRNPTNVAVLLSLNDQDPKQNPDPKNSLMITAGPISPPGAIVSVDLWVF